MIESTPDRPEGTDRSAEPLRWPSLTVRGEVLFIRTVSPAGFFKLQQWGYVLTPEGIEQIPDAAWMAAFCGRFDAAGQWLTRDWPSVVVFLDALLPHEAAQLAPVAAEILQAVNWINNSGNRVGAAAILDRNSVSASLTAREFDDVSAVESKQVN